VGTSCRACGLACDAGGNALDAGKYLSDVHTAIRDEKFPQTRIVAAVSDLVNGHEPVKAGAAFHEAQKDQIVQQR
jgi:hypothetical protein